jgi:hypothetical protein
MLAVTFIVSFLSVCGFYAYVFVQLQREYTRLEAHKKRLAEHLYEMGPEAKTTGADDEDIDDPDSSPRASTSLKAKKPGPKHRDTLIQASLAVGGLAALFAGVQQN